MKKYCFLLLLSAAMGLGAQNVDFDLYTLDNGMDVILHQDNSAPVVAVGVMYHVGAKDEEPTKTGFAHFFEHLLFEGTKNIERGKWFEIVSSNGGTNNANTTQDRTYYYEIFPSNNLELGLWMESERLLHPIINQIGVDTQKEVVQEEKRLRVDNRPYGRVLEQMSKNLFVKHPYRWTTIGSLEHLASATLEDFRRFNELYYVPENAVLVVAGDMDVNETKKLVQDYFGDIPRGKKPLPSKTKIMEDPITEQIDVQFYDPNIQLPLLLHGYRTPEQTTKDAYVLDMISTYLSDGQSSVLYKKLVDDMKIALQIFAFNFSQEDYGSYLVGGLPSGTAGLEDIEKAIDEEIVKIQNELISVKDYQKLQNKMENDFVNSNTSVAGIANSLARYHMLYDDVNLINKEIEIYKSITREDIREAAKKYLNPNQRVRLEYLPESAKSN